MSKVHLEEKKELELNNFPIIAAIDDEIILTTKNISKLIGVHEETVRRWCRSGYVKTISPFGAYKIQGKDFKNFALQWYMNKKRKHR
jgi:hypothetical protein